MIAYRKIIEKEICHSPEIVELLGCENEGNPAELIPYKYSFPYEYIPGTQPETNRWINYEISTAINEKNPAFQDLTIHFFIVCHESNMKYQENGITCLWYDKAACELETIFCEKNVFGAGKAALVSNAPYSPQKEYIGRLLKIVVKDFHNGSKHGK